MNQDKYRTRREAKPEGNNKNNLTTLAESILNKSGTPEEKEKAVERGMLILDEYGIENVVIKGSGSRLIQACLKYGNNSSRELIFLKLMKGDMVSVVKDNFGRIFIIIRQVYRQENHGPYQEQEAFGHFRKVYRRQLRDFDDRRQRQNCIERIHRVPARIQRPGAP